MEYDNSSKLLECQLCWDHPWHMCIQLLSLPELSVLLQVVLLQAAVLRRPSCYRLVWSNCCLLSNCR